MAINPSTPGVYIDEIALLPSSVVGVATGIPAFIGYVEKAENNGVPLLLNVPVRIISMLEYETIFGKGPAQDFSVTVNDVLSTPVQRTFSVTKSTDSPFTLYYQMQMYFANGGGPCWIVPVGYYYSATTPAMADFMKGLDAIAKVDEPTLLVMPELMSISTPSNVKAVYEQALAQCEKLKDRFVIIDVPENPASVNSDISDFRNTIVGPDNLKYGAAYFPKLNSIFTYSIDPSLVQITNYTQNGSAVTDVPEVITFATAASDALASVKNALTAAKKAASTLSLSDALFVQSLVGLAVLDITDTDTASGAALGTYTTAFSAATTATAAADTQAGNVTTDAAAFATAGEQDAANATALLDSLQLLLTNTQAIVTAINNSLTTLSDDFMAGNLAYLQINNPSAYSQITSQINAFTTSLYPSGAMAGIYARVDRERGVWKAPANVGVRSVIGPSKNVTDAEQGEMNIDATSGKSVNAIRAFTGRGTIVWGARTLAGNDNEWRYVNVRRLFNYLEESIQEASEFVVFEPNTANTWQRTKGMIEAFLTGAWKDGALAGATAKDAFFVNVGLGTTMTAQDILEGRMIIEVGVAAVRPAEFIILRFMHKIQES